ncbi:hypothetical protein BDU57DRAFT_269566 [Ampelomyces quisqualis]|uniref:Uncharacterized protein n=1 Tax=Ampelomyces quisqualis TaxID=50730 RepID=A0A6A5QIW9_AMPQU|nr:hypothetical protein BDU57DRAFT_269566 [Ampelomyces quisqualis]
MCAGLQGRSIHMLVQNGVPTPHSSTFDAKFATIGQSRTRQPEDSIPYPWTTRVEMSYLTAKITLYTTVILRPQVDRSSRKILMRNALFVAIRIAYLTDQGLGYTSTEFPGLQSKDLLNTFSKSY